MSEPRPSVLLICTSCRAAGSDPAAPRPGADLLAELRALSHSGYGEASLQGVTCLSGCKRPCAVALLSAGRVSYLFGDLPADKISAAELLQVARDHANVSDGWLPRAARPVRLRSSILARIPPLHWLPTAGNESLIWPV